MDGLPAVEELVQAITAGAATDLDRVRAAVSVADQLGACGEAVVTHFVQAARAAGCPWSQIGAEMGVSKQAAQQAFVAPTAPRRRRPRRRPDPAPTFGRWGAGARAAVTRAQEEAAALGHDHVGTEHLLLGLLAGSDAVAAATLARLGVGQEAVCRELAATLGPGRGPGPPGADLAFTPRAKKVLALAAREAAGRRGEAVEAGHLLLAVVREGEGLAARILVDLGADLPGVGATVAELLRTTGASPAADGRTGG